MSILRKDHRMLAKRLLATACAALLSLGLAACDPGTGAEGGGVSPDDDAGADTGTTGEGFDEVDTDDEEPGDA